MIFDCIPIVNEYALKSRRVLDQQGERPDLTTKPNAIMSRALVSTSTNFQQQGTVDWVELSSRSVQFSVAVLARLSKAGIDPFTLQVGRAICTNFSLNPIAQGRISDAISALKKFGSYGDIIWFGFGVKHVVTDLAETEEGLTLVAICAALSTTYDSLYGARVLRELCALCKAPQSFSPAIRQWKILVELCAGILNSGHFFLVLDGFRRLVSGDRIKAELENNRCPTTYSALAEAILTIAQVTTKRLASATFTGGLDCMWLAAVAEWVFSLDVVIYGSAGVPLYRSRSLDQQPPQITIIYLEEKAKRENQSFLSEKTSLIRSGRTLFVREDHDSLGGVHFFNLRSSWSTILHNTFHESVDMLLTGENGFQFGLYLYCVSMIPEPNLRFKSDHNSPNYAHIFCNNFVDPLLWTQENSRGQKFLSFASTRLPELGGCLENDFSSIPQDEVFRLGLAARKKIECKCDNHPVGVCMKRLAEVIIVFLWILLVSDIDEEIAPSVTGLGNLYRWLNQGDQYHDLDQYHDPMMSIDCQQARQTALVFYVLSGLTVDSEEQVSTPASSNYLAMAGAGVCVYRQGLVDPNLPPDSIFKFRVVSWYISHAGAIFKRIRNLSGRRSPPAFSFDASSTCLSVDTLVQETDRDLELAMAYQVEYIDSEGKRKYLFMSLGRLLRDLQTKVSTIKCEGGCLDLPVKTQRDVDEPIMSKEISSWQDTRRYPVVFFDETATGNAHRLVTDLKRLSNMWFFTSTTCDARPRYCQVKMLIDRPFMIYMYLMELRRDSLCIFPFTPCLSCTVERGCLTRLYQHLREIMPSSGFLWLAGPGGTEENLFWETLEYNHLRETYTVSR